MGRKKRDEFLYVLYDTCIEFTLHIPELFICQYATMCLNLNHRVCELREFFFFFFGSKVSEKGNVNKMMYVKPKNTAQQQATRHDKTLSL